MAWHVGVAANTVIALAYALIASVLYRRIRQVGAPNRLAVATMAIFATCSAGHLEHLVHMLGVPGIASGAETDAARVAYDWHLAAVDVATAGVGVWYWSLRAGLKTAFADGPGLYVDRAHDRARARQINDEIVQGLVVASYALDLGDTPTARRAVDETLLAARQMASTPYGATAPHGARPAAHLADDALATGSGKGTAT